MIQKQEYPIPAEGEPEYEEYTGYTEDDFTFNGTAEAKRTNAGKTYMGLAPEQFENNDDNFDVTFEVMDDGYQEITPI